MEKALAFTQLSINEAGREIPLRPVQFSVKKAVCLYERIERFSISLI
jgi:hypothetical protein